VPDFASFDGTTIHYEDEGEGFPVVCLHGIIANYELNWRAPGITAALVDAGFRVIGADARGHGSSGKPHDSAAYSNDAMVRDVVALFDHLGLEEANVAGYSMGAGVAMRFAGRDDRIHRLVLGGFGGSFGDRSADTERFAAAFDDDATQVPEELVPFRNFALGSGMDMDALRALVRSDQFTGGFEASEISVPTLVICGDADPMQPHELAAALPDGRAKLVGGDHFTAVIDPQLAKEIVAFFSS
jgi:pimeloyl-ACP methyl ester carboxylesterase